MTYNHKIGSGIRSARESRGYSQDYMAEMLKICQSAYAHIESGKTALSLDRLIRISEILEIDIYDLLAKGLGKKPQGESDFKNGVPVFMETKQVYDQLILELKNEIEFLRTMLLERSK